jgi:hypothetical protein
MEHDEKPLPIDIRLLGALAEKVCFLLIKFLEFYNLSQKQPFFLSSLFHVIIFSNMFLVFLHY